MPDRTCSVDGCGRPAISRGVCGAHYMRLKREGNLPPLQPKLTTCSVDGCNRPCFARGWCGMHYKRWAKRGSLGSAEALRNPQQRTDDGLCSIEGCDRSFASRGWCDMHYLRWRRTGSLEDSRLRDRSTCNIDDCSNQAISRGWCGRHYQKWRTHGDPLAPDPRPARNCPSGMGWCPHCLSYKQLSAFYRGKRISSWCRQCVLSDTKATEYWAASRRRRRARLAGVRSESYTPSEIAARDGWRCQLCGKRIGRKLKWPQPRSLSIDHIVPISKGGDDMKSNVQAAHLVCNMSKHNRGTDQLRLIG